MELLQQKGYNNLTAFEIDQELAQEFDCVKYESFVSARIDEKFDLIIGNPPYICMIEKYAKPFKKHTK